MHLAWSGNGGPNLETRNNNGSTQPSASTRVRHVCFHLRTSSALTYGTRHIATSSRRSHEDSRRGRRRQHQSLSSRRKSRNRTRTDHPSRRRSPLGQSAHPRSLHPSDGAAAPR
jgi:hypothetical protein